MTLHLFLSLIFVASKGFLYSVKKVLNILAVLIFINFLALPSIAKVLDFELPQTNMVFTEEEESHSSAASLFEKNIPKTLNVHEFLKFFPAVEIANISFPEWVETTNLSPYLSIVSPPPEF